MAKDALFRNSLGGYNKDDVNKYIEELNVQYTDRGNELETEIRQLRKELEVIPALKADAEKASFLSSEVESLKKETSDLSQAITAQGNELEAKKGEIEALISGKNALELSISHLTQENESLKKELEASRHDFKEEKEKLSDKEARLNDLIAENEAKQSALDSEKADFDKQVDDVLAQLQQEAKSIIDKANEAARLIIKDARKKAEGTGTKPYAPSRPAYTSSKKHEYSEKINGHRSKMDSFFDAITKTLMGE